MEKRGFAFVAVAVLLAATSVVAISMMNILPAKRSMKEHQETLYKMNVISHALDVYVAKNGRLPCPASPTDIINHSSTFGIESRDLTFNCNANGIISSLLNSGQHMGVVPVQTLGLSNDYMIDGWGNKIEYVVSAHMYKAQIEILGFNFTITPPSLIVTDAAGNILNNKTAFILISRGSTGLAAYPAMTSNRNQMPPLSLPLERQNTECQVTGSNCGANYASNVFTVSDGRNSNNILVYHSKPTTCASCNTNSCANAGDIGYWQNAVVTSVSGINTLALTATNPLPYFIIPAQYIPYNQFLLNFTIDSLNITGGTFTLNYDYALTSLPAVTLTTQLATFGNTGATYGPSNVASPISINFGGTNHIPQKLYFTSNITSGNPNMNLNIGQISINNTLYNQDGTVLFQTWGVDNLISNPNIFQLIEWILGFLGNNIFDILKSPLYPNNVQDIYPVTTGYQGLLGYSLKYLAEHGIYFWQINEYGARIFGYITPTVSGNYTFSLNSSGTASLFLSPSPYEGDKVQVQTVTTYGIGQYLWGHSTNAAATYNLTAGQSYYMEIMGVSQDFNQDHFEVGWQVPGTSSTVLIPSSVLSTYPKSLNGNGACSSAYSTTVNLTPATTFQPADVINLQNTPARYVKLTLNSTQPLPTGYLPTNDIYMLREVRFADANNNILPPANMKILRYSSSYSDGSTNFFNYSPNYLFNEGNITSSYAPPALGQISTIPNMVWATSNKTAPQWVIIDLGASYTLGSAYVWNANQLYTACCPDRSVLSLTVTVSDSYDFLLQNAR